MIHVNLRKKKRKRNLSLRRKKSHFKTASRAIWSLAVFRANTYPPSPSLRSWLRRGTPVSVIGEQMIRV